MTGSSGRELDPAVDSAVDLLVALTPPERAEYAAHLRGRAGCRREADRVARLLVVLGRVTGPAALERGLDAGSGEGGSPNERV